jgi:hypothetical protein
LSRFTNPAADRDWFYFVARSGEEGRRWVEVYRQPEFRSIVEGTLRALALLRRNRLEEGAAVLEEIRPGVELSRTTSASLFHVLERHYYPVLAYYHYRRDELREAEDCLDTAFLGLKRAVEIEPRLLPLVDSCLDFSFQHARIARNQRKWQAMREHLLAAGAMIEGTRPFFVLDDGTGIGISTLRGFYESLGLSEEESACLRYLAADELRMTFEHLAAEVCRIPGLVLPYP